MSIFLSIQLILDQLKSAAAFISNHRTEVLLFSSITAAIFVPIFLVPLRRSALNKAPKEEWESDKGWAKLFVAAVAVWSVQYGVQFLYQTSKGHLWISEETVGVLRYVVSFFVYACSGTNNLLFLSAALKLTSSERVIPSDKPEPLFPQPGLPLRYYLFALIGLVGGLDALPLALQKENPVFLVVRIPDIIFSSYCLYKVGMGIAVNISFYRQRRLARLAAFVATSYVIVQILYGINPFLAQFDKIWHYFPDEPTFSVRLAVLDNFIFAAALPLKFGLLFPAYILLMQDLFTFKDLRKALHLVTHGRAEFLSRAGLVRSVGERLGADLVDLCIKLPGKERNRIASLIWRKGEMSSSENPSKTKNIDEFMEKKPLNEGEQIIRDCFEKQTVMIQPTVIAVPVYYHGAVIACLKVGKSDPSTLSTEAIQQMRELAAIASPSIQSYRELTALDQISVRVAVGSVRENHFHDFLVSFSGILHDILSPPVFKLEFRLGFHQHPPVYLGHPYLLPSFKRNTSGHYFDELPTEFQDTYFNEQHDIFGFKLLRKERLLYNPDDYEGFEVGHVAFALPAVRRDSYPALGTKLLHRKAIASVVLDAFNDHLLTFFNKLVKEFSTDLNRERINIPAWFENVAKLAKNAGLLWVVSTQQGSDELLVRNPVQQDAITLVQLFRKKIGDPETIESWSCNELKQQLTNASTLVERTQRIICVPLGNTMQYVWFGVEREEFGDELRFLSPWRVFLDSFADVASSALIRYTTAKEFQQLQINAARSNELATVVATTGTLIHQLMNLARNQSATTSTLADALALGHLQTDKEIAQLILGINEVSARQLSLLENLIDHSIVDDHRPCSLHHVVDQASHLFNPSLMLGEIMLENEVPPEISIDIPFHIASLALSNLIGNAKDAIKHKGTIRVQAEEADDFVLCRVSDDGPGIPANIAGKIFDLGVTTKSHSGGWGLYLVIRSLQENGSLITLEDTGNYGTTFTIRFPKSRKEEPNGSDGNFADELWRNRSSASRT